MDHGKIDRSGFSAAEQQRYDRHFLLPGFGEGAQRKLKNGCVLVIGAGGLGSPLLLYLAAAGVGQIGIVDFDEVDASNLHRQVIFDEAQIGESKVEAAKARLQGINPLINIVSYSQRLTSANAMEIITGYDVVADGSDNFATRYLVNDACVLAGKPNVYGSIFQFEGQVSVFNHRDEKGRYGPNYRDLFPSPPPSGLVPNCAETGVLGVLPGIIGSMQALEVIKILAGIGEVMSGRLWLFDALAFESRTIKIGKRADNPLNGEHPTIHRLIDYEAFCGVGQGSDIKGISVDEFQEMKRGEADFQLVDVREAQEYRRKNIGGFPIPLSRLEELHEQIAKDKKVIIHCESGARSATAIRTLAELYGYTNLYNLEGGIRAYLAAFPPVQS
ncbi:adenylyltransferase and sulfurtransferase [Cyclobacterium lianum]|uniref:Molybdopterin-synthase adenylyltransferase n=1 Tax=Cyclobacterium lianum TaxID=388280 RepID=A0A1M7QB23_9BACT|nr:molybdopterin-synthase adenylyltransferase MoeB [Cyclobacterium lianum]SHN27927.1 adenylyltransferase and sulfurtransferase [Cyclobacterium lianum]